MDRPVLQNTCETCPAHSVENLTRLGVNMDNWDYAIALAGNPNTGKSTVFNSLTGGDDKTVEYASNAGGSWMVEQLAGGSSTVQSFDFGVGPDGVVDFHLTWWHLVSVILHTLNALLVFRLLRTLLRGSSPRIGG